MGTHPIFESDFDCLTEMSDEMIDFSSKTVAELKAECKSKGLPVSGKKQELIDRLEEYMKEQASAEITEDDLLQDEPDVSIGEESQEQESPPAEKVEEPVPEPTQPVDDMEKRKLERFLILSPYLVYFCFMSEQKSLALKQMKLSMRRKSLELSALGSLSIKKGKQSLRVWMSQSMSKKLKSDRNV